MCQPECLVCSEDFSTLINNAGDVERQGLHIALHGSHADRKAQCVLRQHNTELRHAKYVMIKETLVVPKLR